MTAQGVIIAAPRSGSGKTSVTIGLLRALKRRGIVARGVKSGPDYIDPGFHRAASGLSGMNLDSWVMAPDLLDTLGITAARDSEYLIIESAMGLFDGIEAGAGRRGSASDLAARYGWPVVLVLDVSGQSQTAAVIAKGFATFDPSVRVAGVVLNQVASERHHAQAAAAIERAGVPVLGSIRRNPDMALPERHLGLVQAEEIGALEAFIDRLADVMEASLDIDAILRAATPATPATFAGNARIAIAPPGQRIAVARDAAFSFLYPHLLWQWREAGAEIVPFSPLADEGPDPSCNVCWLPGGYPELHAGRLAAAERFLEATRAFAAVAPVHGECGGFMVLGEAIEDADGDRHKMLGLLGHTTSFARRRMNLGYRRARLLGDCPIGRSGTWLRGHEFHYATLVVPGDDAPLAELCDGLDNPLGMSGARRLRVSGTFFHAMAAD